MQSSCIIKKEPKKILSSIEKYIDLNQFPMTKSGNIAWKNSIGICAEFYVNGIKHSLEIIERNKNVLSLKIDDDYIITTNTTEIKRVNFTRQMKLPPEYYYKVGQEIDDIVIIECLYKMRKSHGKYRKVKMYKCRCKIDGHEWTTEEKSLKAGTRCPLCARNITISGVNDVETQRPDLVDYFNNKDDAKTISCFSTKKVLLKCPFCGHVFKKNISTLVSYGFSCPMCSDGVSYPNKFARNLFSQLSEQYDYYEYEWSPKWAGRYVYDNYIELKDGRKLIVEMDGGQHYKNDLFFKTNNTDAEKDILAKEHGILVARINCNYSTIEKRYTHIKNNTLEKMKDYFDFSKINWRECVLNAETNLFHKIVNEFNKNPNIKYQELAKLLGLKTTTVKSALYRARKMSLCDYKQKRHCVST